jgi:hypothetical protein
MKWEHLTASGLIKVKILKEKINKKNYLMI